MYFEYNFPNICKSWTKDMILNEYENLKVHCMTKEAQCEYLKQILIESELELKKLEEIIKELKTYILTKLSRQRNLVRTEIGVEKQNQLIEQNFHQSYSTQPEISTQSCNKGYQRQPHNDIDELNTINNSEESQLISQQQIILQCQHYCTQTDTLKQDCRPNLMEYNHPLDK